MDTEATRDVLAAAAVVLFNIPVLFTTWKMVFFAPPTTAGPGGAAPATAPPPNKVALKGLTDALQEKDADGNPTGVISYSRVTGMIGTSVVASLFWMISNIVIAMAVLDPQSISGVLTDVSKLFLIGAALFVPYAFNQLKSLLQ